MGDAMPECTPEEMALILRTAEVLKKYHFSHQINISKLCQEADISRKNAYKHKKKFDFSLRTRDQNIRCLEQIVAQLQEKLKNAELRAQEADLYWELRNVLVALNNDDKKKSGPDAQAPKAYRRLQQRFKLSGSRAAELLGVTRQRVASWITIINGKASKSKKKSRRGHQRTFVEAHVFFVRAVWESYAAARKKVRITAFMKHLKKEWANQPWEVPCPSRQAVSDMLKGNDCRQVVAKKSRSSASGYIEKTKRYHPGFQVPLDGKEVVVSLREQEYPFVVELCQDMATKELALSILKQIVAIYIRLRNQTPRCSVCPFTPEKMMNYQPGENGQQAYDQLKAAIERKEKQQEQRMKVSQEFHDLIDSIIKEQRLEGDSLRFKKCLKHVELNTIREAEQQFAVQSGRDTFDEAKRTMVYFSAIARNMPLSFRACSSLHKNRLRHVLVALLKRNSQKRMQRIVQRTEKEIMNLNHYALDVRDEMVNMVHQYINGLVPI